MLAVRLLLPAVSPGWSYGAQVVLCSERDQLDVLAGSKGLDHLPVADVHPHVAEVGVVEDEVTWLEFVSGDPPPLVPLAPV